MTDKSKLRTVHEINQMPNSRAAPAGIKVVADLSIAHLTKEDAEILEHTSQEQFPGFIGGFDEGWFVTTFPHRFQLKKLGFSPSYIEIMATLYDAGIYYACFDQDGPKWSQFETFE